MHWNFLVFIFNFYFFILYFFLFFSLCNTTAKGTIKRDSCRLATDDYYGDGMG